MEREEIIGIICDIYEDYKISEFGFDLFKICGEMGIEIIPYSSFKKEEQKILIKQDEDGFSGIFENKVKLYYNDKIKHKLRIKFTFPHEIGHSSLGHYFDEKKPDWRKEYEANIFANEFYCPQAFMIYYHIKSVSALMKVFGVSKGYAYVLLEKLRKRESNKLSPNELRLIKIFESNKRNK